MTPIPHYTSPLITLYRGDCTSPDLAAIWTQATTLITDPPYGITWNGIGTYRRGVMHFTDCEITGDQDTGIRDTMLQLWDQAGDPDRAALLFGSWRKPRPPHTRHRLIWHKALGGLGPTRNQFILADEEIYILGRRWIRTSPPMPSVITTTEHRSQAVRQAGHPTPKPIGLMETLISRVEPHPGMVIADPFAGSGATLIACQNLGIPAIGIEISTEYCDLIASRLDQDKLPI